MEEAKQIVDSLKVVNDIAELKLMTDVNGKTNNENSIQNYIQVLQNNRYRVPFPIKLVLSSYERTTVSKSFSIQFCFS